MDVVVKGRRTEVSEQFRSHAVEKLSKVERLDSKVISVDVEVIKERNPRLADSSDRVELTCRTRGPVVRAEAAAGDPFAALDLAWEKLEARLRKAADRRRVHHGNRTPMSVAAATASLSLDGDERPGDDEPEVTVRRTGSLEVVGDGPPVVREKVHKASPMTLDQALFEMELVGHDFYLFVDAESSWPSVVYRRKGYDYGVIRLAV